MSIFPLQPSLAPFFFPIHQRFLLSNPQPTHFSSSGSFSVIDLTFIHSTLSHSFSILPPLSSSYHQSVLLNVSYPKVQSDQFRPTHYRGLAVQASWPRKNEHSLLLGWLEFSLHPFNIILFNFCLQSNLISPVQLGFLLAHSTTIALLYCTHSVLTLLENHSSVFGIFLDIKKAFNSVPHSPLLYLLQSLNVHPVFLNQLHSYLLSRWILLPGQTCLFRRSSRLHSQSVPSFLLYINGVSNLPLSPNSQLILYADDILFFKPIDSLQNFSSFQSDLDSVSLSSNWLQLNSNNKSKYKIFFDSYPSLQIANCSLQCVSSFHYLGMHLLLVSPHLHSFKGSENPWPNFRHFYRFSTPETITSLYIAHLILEYCSPVWSLSATLSNSLESIQTFALKLATKFQSPTLSPLSQLKLSSWSSIQLTYFYCSMQLTCTYEWLIINFFRRRRLGFS